MGVGVLLISIGMMVYPPYHTVIHGKGEMFEGYNIIGEAPKIYRQEGKNLLLLIIRHWHFMR